MEWLHKRVRVHLKDGGALEGTVEHIDLAGNQLSLSSGMAWQNPPPRPAHAPAPLCQP